MKTLTVNIENLCAACRCRCRHCLLSSSHRATGVDYHRGLHFAERFYAWMKKSRSDLGGTYYTGYCMDFPELTEYIAWQKSRTGMEHLLFDGMAFRSEKEVNDLMSRIFDAGAREISLTFYGTAAYHDRFAGRAGDFNYLLLLTETALCHGLRITAGIMLTQENMEQMSELFMILGQYPFSRITVILPHDKGRGEGISHLRLTDTDYDRLCPEAKACFARKSYRTEAEWLQLSQFPDASSRHLTLSLTSDNIDLLESMEPSGVITLLESMDDAYYAALPSIEELALLCGQPDNRQLFRFGIGILPCRSVTGNPIPC